MFVEVEFHISLLSQLCSCALVKFCHKIHLVRVRIMVVWPKTSGSVATLSLEQCPDILSEICRGVTLKYCGKILQIYENTISHLCRMYSSLCLFMLNHRVQYVCVVVIRPNIIQRNVADPTTAS